MIKHLIHRACNKIIGNNLIFRRIIKKHYDSGHYVKAAALMMYLFPVRKSLRLAEYMKGFEFIASPEYYSELQELLHISKAEGFDLVRIGAAYDGGYILLNDFNGGGTAYSFGISRDVSWDKDMASRGYDVFMYDHTIDSLPEENERFHWFKLGISDGSTNDFRLKTLEELIAQNRHQDKRDMILKMDVEGAEWGFIKNVKPETLKRFSQMTFEFHNIPNHDNPGQVIETFRKLNENHELVHIHINNNAQGYIMFSGKKFSPYIELSYVLRDKYKFADKYDVSLPLSIDAPNHTGFNETELGRWNDESVITERAKVEIRMP